MKILFVCICCALCFGANAQETVSKSYPAKAGQLIALRFDYPVVKISTWDKNEVSVVAHVDINDHENDSAFELNEEVADGKMVIKNHIKDMNSLPRRYTIVRNGVKTVYRSREDYEAARTGPGIQQTYEGLDMHITLEIKIPVNCTTDLNAIYGIVELADFHAPITINAEYAGIDATIATATTGKLQATTRYGQIYSNLDMHITDHDEHDFYNSITSEPGKGPSYNFSSPYGKIYLRKP